jgi:nitrate/TMAO reductase-like tetraheme cytochrome c subunit
MLLTPKPARRSLVPTAVLLLLFLAAGFSHVEAAAAGALATDRLNPSQACGQCHTDIFKAWQGTVHARSFTDPLFQKALERTDASKGVAARRECLVCHAPAAVLQDDVQVTSAVSRDGVGCDFCHSVKSVDMSRWPMPFEMGIDGVKRGPYAYLESPAHLTAYSTLHRDSPLLCAACHQYRNKEGAEVLSTYSEWSAGPYPALGVSCQDCHMAVVPGERVRPDVAAAPDQRIINLHRLVGSSSLSQLRRGIEAAIVESGRSGGNAQVRVEVRNVAAGHKVPTGLPAKQIRLILTASREGKPFHTEERLYARTLVDESGRIPATEGDLFLASRKVKSDTRLAPRETRTETFRFAAPPGEVAVSARLVYTYRPLVGGEGVEETLQDLRATIPR